MAKAKPLTWTLSFTISPLWVQDGFALCNERAHNMLSNELGRAHSDELGAVILEAPSAKDIALLQGYQPGSKRLEKYAKELTNGTPSSGHISAALKASKKLIKSGAFASKKGDPQKVIEQIDKALALLAPRQGKSSWVES